MCLFCLRMLAVALGAVALFTGPASAANPPSFDVMTINMWHKDKPHELRVMADYMRAYEVRRVAGLHDGPRMTEIHLYRLTWKLRPDGTHATRPWKQEQLLTLKWDELEHRPTTPPVELPHQPPDDDSA